ncbi:MAG: DUF881 domain-containing protein [Frankia sp.]|nr:DUF881 domain-containing protein [Frankia sp.]
MLAAGLLLGIAAGTHEAGRPERDRALRALDGEVARRASDVTRLTQQADELGEEVVAAQTAASELAALATAVAALEPAAAARPAHGPGLRVVVADAGQQPAAQPGGDPRDPGALGGGRVTDAQLADLVNALWSGQASAIAINGVRLSGLGAVRAAGQAILVGLQPVSSPYRIEAVGDPRALTVALYRSRTGARLAEGRGGGARLQEVSVVDELGVPAAEAGEPRLARPLPGPWSPT